MSLLQYEQDKELSSRVELYLFESDDGRYRYWSLDAVRPAEIAAVGADRLDALLLGREWSP